MDEEHGEALDAGGGPGAGPPRDFDRALSGAHAYLGELKDLAAEAEGPAGLAPGARVQLPLLAMGNAVLPGMTFPLKTDAGSETERALSGALASPSPPLRRLVACFFRSPAYSVLGRFGCVAAIEAMEVGPAGAAEAERGGFGSKGWLLRGLHRAEISNSLGRGARAFRPHFARWTPPGAAGSVVMVEVEVLGEPQLRVPAGAAKGHLHAAPFVWKLVDTGRVAQEVASAIRTTLPRQVQPPEALVKDPVALSYWVLSNVPSVSSRLILEALAAPDVWARLRMCRAIVESLEFLCCTLCSSSIASLGDLVIMSEESASQQYVNAHGFTHDVVTVARSRNLKEMGIPETQHSWFPGYAWTICNCRLCGAHLGWHFTAAEVSTCGRRAGRGRGLTQKKARPPAARVLGPAAVRPAADRPRCRRPGRDARHQRAGERGPANELGRLRGGLGARAALPGLAALAHVANPGAGSGRVAAVGERERERERD